MLEASQRLVDKGADVVVLGSTTMASAHEFLSARLDVPVINPGPLSYKLVEAFLATGLAHSRKAYPEPIVPKIDLVHDMVDAGQRSELERNG
jgi:allantoin racemase